MKDKAIFPIFTGRERRTSKPTFFRPRSRKPEKMISEFLSEARRIIAETEKIRTRHKAQIEAADFSPKFDEPNFVYQVFSRMISDGQPDQFSYEFHELRREFISIEENKSAFNPFGFFLRLSKTSGGSPLWHAIWTANSCLRLLYEEPASPQDELKIEPWFFYDAMISVSILAFYIEVSDRYGEEMLMAILNGAEIEVGYSLPSGPE